MKLKRNTISITEWNLFHNEVLEISDYQDSDATNIIINFSIQPLFEGEGLPIENFWEKIKPEAIEKSVIEYRQTSKENPVLGLLWF